MGLSEVLTLRLSRKKTLAMVKNQSSKGKRSTQCLPFHELGQNTIKSLS